MITLRSLLNELARLIPKLGVKQASSFDRDLIVVSLCVLNEETFFRRILMQTSQGVAGVPCRSYLSYSQVTQ